MTYHLKPFKSKVDISKYILFKLVLLSFVGLDAEIGREVLSFL